MISLTELEQEIENRINNAFDVIVDSNSEIREIVLKTQQSRKNLAAAFYIILAKDRQMLLSALGPEALGNGIMALNLTQMTLKEHGYIKENLNFSVSLETTEGYKKFFLHVSMV